MSRLLIIILLATIAPTTTALVLAVQTARPFASSNTSTSDVRSINIDGRALITVMPDKATQTFVAAATGATREAAQAAVDARIEKTLAAVLAAGVKAADLRSQTATLTPEYARDARGEPQYLHVKYWTANRALTVCIHDITDIANVKRAAEGAGALASGDILFETTQVEALQTEARLQAAHAARAKAEAMVTALGGRLGGPINIHESTASAPAYSGMKNTSDDRTEDAVGVVDGDVAAGKLSITAQVSVTFEILRGT